MPPDQEAVIPLDGWRPHSKFRFLSPVKPTHPKRARIIAARAYVDWLGLTIDDLATWSPSCTDANRATAKKKGRLSALAWNESKSGPKGSPL